MAHTKTYEYIVKYSILIDVREGNMNWFAYTTTQLKIPRADKFNNGHFNGCSIKLDAKVQSFLKQRSLVHSGRQFDPYFWND
jgi:hypothetical protein